MCVSLLLWPQAGTSYAFGVYSSDLKSRLDLTQDELQQIGAIGNLGLYLTFVGGIVFQASGSYGPYVTSAGAVLLTALGYLLMWGGTSGVLPGSVSLLSAAAFIWSHGSAWGDLAAISVQTRNFPKDRGIVLGLLKSFFGLSATLFTVAYDTMFPGDASAFLLFLAVVIPSLFVAGGLTQRFSSNSGAFRLDAAGIRRMHWGYAVVVAAAVFATIATVLIKTGAVGPHEVGWFVGLLAIIAGFGCLAFPLCPCHRSEVQPAHDASATVDSDATETLLAESEASPAQAAEAGTLNSREDAEDGEGARSGGEEEEDGDGDERRALGRAAGAGESDGSGGEAPLKGATLWEGLSSLDFWLIFVLLFAGTGSGLTLINNVGQMVPSLGGGGAEVYVALLGVGNAFGRMAFGILSDLFRRVLSRPGWLTVSVMSMALSMLITAFADLGVLYFSVFLTGFSYGGFWSLMPALLADRFGNRSFATLYAVASLAPAAGSLLLGEKMASAIYVANSPPGSNTCVGDGCFRGTFLILCGLCAVASGIGGYLALKLRDFYRSMLIEAGDMSPEEAEREDDLAPIGSRHNLGAVLERGGVFKDSPAETPVMREREHRQKRRAAKRA